MDLCAIIKKIASKSMFKFINDIPVQWPYLSYLSQARNSSSNSIQICTKEKTYDYNIQPNHIVDKIHLVRSEFKKNYDQIMSTPIGKFMYLGMPNLSLYAIHSLLLNPGHELYFMVNKENTVMDICWYLSSSGFKNVYQFKSSYNSLRRTMTTILPHKTNVLLSRYLITNDYTYKSKLMTKQFANLSLHYARQEINYLNFSMLLKHNKGN